MRFSNRRIKITILGVSLVVTLLFGFIPALDFTWKKYSFSGFTNQSPDIPPADPHPKAKPRISAEVQLHLKQVFDSLNAPSFAETNDGNQDQQDFDNALNDLKTAEDDEDRAYAVTVIGLSSKKEAIPAIIKALNDPSSLVRQEALERILGWPDDKQQEIMMIAALKSKDMDMVYVALESIYETNNKALLRQINRLRKSKDNDIAKLASEVYKNLTEL
jgi:HEAT repeat protein